MELIWQNKKFNWGNILAEWVPCIETDGRTEMPIRVFQQEKNCFKINFEKLEWNWETEYRGERLLIRSEIRNISDETVKLGKFTILNADVPVLTDAKDIRALAVPDRGQDARKVLSVTSSGAPQESQIKFQFYSAAKATALQVGFVTFQRLYTKVSRRVEDGKIRQIVAYADFEGWILEAGEKTPFEEFTVSYGDSPFTQLEEWADIAAERIRPVFQKNPVFGIGSGAWSYTDVENENREQKLLHNLDAINEKLAGYGFEYARVSNSNIPDGNPGDWFGWNDHNFPHGPEYLVSEVAKRGFKLGLWNGPFMISSKLTKLVEEMWDALYKTPDGKPMVFMEGWKHGDAAKYPVKERPDIYGLDPSHPKSLDFIRRVFSYWHEMGIRCYMIDFVRIGAGKLDAAPTFSHADPKLVKSAESFCGFMKAIREAATEDTYLLISSGPTFPCSGYTDAMRTGNDFGEGRDINPEAFFYPASFIINSLDFWTGPERALYNMASYYTHRKLYQNDIGNVLTLDSPIPLEYARISATIHGMSGCGSMLGDQISLISQERLSMIKKTIPRHTKQAYPEDLFTHKEGKPPRISRYDFPNSSVLAVYNITKEEEIHTLHFKGNFAVWEFWNETFCGSGKDVFEVRIPAGTVRVFHFVKRQEHPCLLATDMHILMGELDTKSEWEEDTLSLSIKRPAAERGSLFVYVPTGWYVKNTSRYLIVKDGKSEEVIVRVPCTTDDSGQWHGQVTFGKIEDAKQTVEETEERKYE